MMWNILCYIYLYASLSIIVYSFQGFRSRNILSSSWKRSYRPQLAPEDDYIPETIEITNFTGPGCVLVIHSGDYDHFLMKQAVFVFNHNDTKGTQGVIVNKETAFTMGEVSPNISPFDANTLYTGGNDGPDMATMLHRFELNGSSKYVGGGIYLGGIRAAQQFVTDGNASPKEFKFFFNVVEWGPGVLRKEIEQGRWHVVRVPPDYIVGKPAANLWSMATNLIASKAIADHVIPSKLVN